MGCKNSKEVKENNNAPPPSNSGEPGATPSQQPAATSNNAPSQQQAGKGPAKKEKREKAGSGAREDSKRRNSPQQPEEEHREPPREKDSRFKGVGPTEQALQNAEVFPCFANGLLFRLSSANAWYFYNDTQDYEMNITFTFGPESKITALGKATMRMGSTPETERSFIVSVVVYPGETEGFIEGKYNGYKSNIAAQPLSEEYRKRMNAEANRKVQSELDVIAKLTRGSTDTEKNLESCVAQRVMFVDVRFPPVQSSLSRPGVDTRQIAETAWRRPTDYIPVAQHDDIALFRDDIHPNDIDQGQLGDCWLLCSIAALAEFPEKVRDIFCHPVSETAAAKEQAIGAYRVTLNKHGWWHILVVDDYLPVVGQKPCFAKDVQDLCELWVSLLEKAYAKLHGSYAAITGGDALQALQDLTGYPVNRFDEEWEQMVADRQKGMEMFDALLHYDKEKYLINLNTPGHDTSAYMGAASKSNTRTTEEKYKKAGLALGHAYTVLEAKFFPNYGLRLLKIRNPWGNGVEWTGRWSDNDSHWSEHPDVAKGCNFEKADDGTFWMDWDDAKEYFDGGGVCFTKFDWFDYRAKGAFDNGFPTLVLEVHVTKPVQAFAVLCQKDKRGLASNDPDSKYAAMMLSISHSTGAGGKQRVHLNSTSDAEKPSEQYTFNYSRDLGMLYDFVPEKSPYYIIPRIFDAGASKSYVLGLISDTEAGSAALTVNFRALNKKCRVFQNHPVFTVEGETEVRTLYQVNPEIGAPQTIEGTRFV